MGDENDAKWLAENVLLPALERIEGQIAETNKRMEERDGKLWKALDEVKECQTKLKVKDAEIEGDIEKIKAEKKATEQILIRHVENREKHYNPFYTESLGEKLWRKKPEIAAGGILGTVLSIIALILTKVWGG